MLVLTIKEGGTIVIGDDIRITVVDIRSNRVRIGIEAPDTVAVERPERTPKMNPEEDT